MAAALGLREEAYVGTRQERPQMRICIRLLGAPRDPKPLSLGLLRLLHRLGTLLRLRPAIGVSISMIRLIEGLLKLTKAVALGTPTGALVWGRVGTWPTRKLSPIYGGKTITNIILRYL